MKKYSMIAVVSIITTIMFLSGCTKQEITLPNRPLVKTEKIIIQNSSDKFNYSGEVHGRYESNLAFQVGGKIIDRYVDLGSSVKQGEVLLAIDSKDIVQNVNSGSAGVEAARTQLRHAEANYKRYKQLYKQEAVSEMTYDQYKTAYEEAAANLKVAESQYIQSNNSLDYSKLRANVNGVISSINAEVGQVVAAGQTIVTLVRDGQREVEINIPENNLGSVQINKSVTVTFWALPKIKLMGVIREIAPMADPASRTYKIRVLLNNPPKEVTLGMTANVSLEKNEGAAVIIPLSAIYQVADKPQVWVVRNGQVTLRNIIIDSFDKNNVKVLSGLKNGEIIVVAGVHKLRDGQAVRMGDVE